MRMNDEFINELNKATIIPGDGLSTTNSKYLWYFHDFNVSAQSTKRPTSNDIALAQKELCKETKIKEKKEFYEYNLSGSAIAIKKMCNANKANIKLRNTSNYLEDVLERFAENLNIQDFVNTVKEIDK